MKVAICFWGLCRSTDITIDSIKRNVYDILKTAGIEYGVFVHTFSITRLYSNDRSQERALTLNNELYKLLEPTAAEIEDQDECDASLNLAAYRTNGDAWDGQGLPWQTFDNHIRALYSLYKVTQMSKGDYDYVIYLRPDCRFLTPLNIRWFGSELILTDFSKCPVNDRFALGPPDKTRAFGERYLKALEFSKQSKLHS